MILFDLDHFGDLNKRHGLAAGDAVLQRFGRILGSEFREADLVARYGGEEFLVLLGGASLADAEKRANAVRELVAAPPDDPMDDQPVTVSAGCAAIEADQEADLARLIAAADVALNQAKRAGRNRVVSAAL
jgi:diguanylate cyclase (GGDEF)-like protein